MDEMLKYAVENGMIDLSHIQECIEIQQRKELIERHPYKIYESKDGKWCTYLPDKKKGRVFRKRNTKKELEDLVVEYWKAEVDNPTIEEVFTEWNDRRLELKKIVASTHTRNKQVFNRHYKEFGKHKIKSVSPEDFTEFLEEQIPEYNLTAKAFANLKGVTRGVLLRAKRRGLISFSPDEVFEEADISDTEFRKNVKEDCEEVFDEEETDLMERYLIEHQDIWNLGILLMFVSGIRVGELVALKWDCFYDDEIYIRRTETRYEDDAGMWRYRIKEFPKTRAGWRTIVIPQAYQWIWGALREMSGEEEYVFSRNHERMTTACIRARIYRVCDKVGIQRRSPHKVRKTYCSILFDNKIDSKLIKDQMGHVDIMCSELNYHRNRKRKDQKIDTISAIPEFRQKLALVK
ncbi:MAG: tyrosine-type recombinase/integrase [Clostridiales bacterium]|nr:tyrosine-type recombinase/integrase [Clostridiales bacterium]